MEIKKIKSVLGIVCSVACLSCLGATIYSSAQTLAYDEVNQKSAVMSVEDNNNLTNKPESENMVNEDKCYLSDTRFDSIQSEIWHKMLNSIDYYKSVSGKMLYSDCPGINIFVEYETNIDKSVAYSKVQEVNVGDPLCILDNDFSSVSVADTYSVEVFTDDDSLITLDNLRKVAVSEKNSVYGRENSGAIPDDERVIIEEDGTPGYYYRCDITNTFIASASLLPQEMAFGFLTDFNLWEIDGIDKYAERECFVVTGKTSNNYGKKIGVSDFTMYIDCETGVLLKYMGYDENKNLHAYIVTEEIVFEEENDIYKPSIEGYLVSDCS